METAWRRAGTPEDLDSVTSSIASRVPRALIGGLSPDLRVILGAPPVSPKESRRPPPAAERKMMWKMLPNKPGPEESSRLPCADKGPRGNPEGKHKCTPFLAFSTKSGTLKSHVEKVRHTAKNTAYRAREGRPTPVLVTGPLVLAVRRVSGARSCRHHPSSPLSRSSERRSPAFLPFLALASLSHYVLLPSSSRGSSLKVLAANARARIKNTTILPPNMFVFRS